MVKEHKNNKKQDDQEAYYKGSLGPKQTEEQKSSLQINNRPVRAGSIITRAMARQQQEEDDAYYGGPVDLSELDSQIMDKKIIEIITEDFAGQKQRELK